MERDAWVYATVTFVGSDIKVAVDKTGDVLSLRATPWWYITNHDAPTTDVPNGTALSLTADGAATAKIDAIRMLPVREMEMEFTKRVGEGGALGNRAARRAILMLQDSQTPAEQAQRESLYRNRVGWGKFHAAKGGSLAAKISSGTPLTPNESKSCRDLALHYAKQVVQSPQLAAIWGNDSDDAPLADAHDDEEEDEDEEETTEMFHTSEVTDSVFYRHEHARFLSPSVYRDVEALKSRDADAILAAISPGDFCKSQQNSMNVSLHCFAGFYKSRCFADFFKIQGTLM